VTDLQPTAPRKGRDWNAVAAMLGGVAALITACVGALAFVASQHDSSGSGTEPARAGAAATGTTAAAPTGTSPSRSVAAAAPPGPQAAWQQVWQGSFRFDNNGVNFDQEPPLRNAGGALQIYSGGTTVVPAGAGGGSVRIAALDRGDPGTPEACAAKLDAFSTSSVPLDTGRRVCVHTTLGRVVLMTVVSRMDESSWNVTATVWRPAG
jgi:hypothetical protein